MKNHICILITLLITVSNLYAQMTIIQTPTNNVDQSLDFYQKLNYKVIAKEPMPVLTDGKGVIQINPDRFARAGVKMYSDSWKEKATELKELTMVWDIDNGYLLNEGNGCWIYLLEGETGFEFTPEESPFGMAGNFMGVSLETSDMERSYKIWELLGFSIVMGELGKGFIVMANESGFSVSMMNILTCPHLFFNPSMTFFNGDKNMEIIKNIREAGIPITEEITHFNKEGIVDNIIIRDPGGLGFFIFSD